MELGYHISEGPLRQGHVVSNLCPRSCHVHGKGSDVGEISCPRSDSVTDLWYEHNDPFERTAAVSAHAAIVIGLLLDIAQYEVQGFATSNAAPVS